jgi:hypothetical protein
VVEKMARKVCWLVTVWLLWWTGSRVSAQEQENLDAVCKEVLCRNATTIRVRVTGKPQVEVPFPRSIVFGDGKGIILPGETVYLEAEEKNGVLLNVHAIPTLKVKAKTIVFKFEQMKGELDGHMMLTVTNPFSKTLRYHMGIRRVGNDAMKKTSACSVIPKGQSFEHWPDPLVVLGFKDLHLVEPDSPGANECEP